MADRTTVVYRLLGPIEVVVDGVRRPLSGYRQELLLAALVLAAGREVPTDQLVELLWEDAPPHHPDAALRSQVARLRRVVGLEAGDVTFGVRGYRLAPAGVVDVDQFELLADQAHRLDGGPALDAADAALRLWRSADLRFAHRLVLGPTAVRLMEMRNSLVERRAGLLVSRGRAPEAIAELRALLTERPEHEGLRALLMEALCRSGRPTEALDVYRTWRDTLRGRGLEPPGRLRELEVRILREDLTASDSRPVADRLGAPDAWTRAAATSFVGRSQDVERLAGALQEHRVVTLIGPGGVGKTRLAWEVLRSTCADRSVIDVDLATVDEPTDVGRLIAGAAGVTEVSGQPLLDQVVDRLADRPGLLLLDNCEHVLGEVAELVAMLVARAPWTTVLATSQRRLAVAGEWLWPVTPLPIEGSDSPAVQLFLDRACEAAPNCPLIDGDVERIQRICAALDGLPLGIEIAAAQTSALSLADLEAELENPLELQAPTTRPPRHQTLRTVIDWTYQRLDEREQRGLVRLCVFVGPFDLTAARVVLSEVVPSSQIAACIVQLVDRSLLSFQTVDDEGHYRTLQGVRAFGLDRLRATGELGAAQLAHARWAVEFAEQAARDLADDEPSTVQRLGRCFDDLRAAHHWLVAFDADRAMRLIHALHPYAFWHGRTEVFRWAEVAAALDSASPMRASVKASVCAGAWIRGDLHTADLAARAALAAVTEPGSPLARRAFAQAGEIALQRGDADRAVAMYDRALQLSLLVDDHMQATWDLGSSALILGYTGQLAEADRRAARATEISTRVSSPSARSFAAFVRGELAATQSPADARAHLEKAIELAESVDNRFIAALARVTLASLEPEGGHDLGAAVEHYMSAVASWERAGAWFAQLVTLRNVVGLLASNGAVEDAATLYGAVMVGARTASPIYGNDRVKIERIRTTIGRQLGEDRATRLASVGANLNPQEVIDFTLRALGDCRRRAGCD